MAEPIIPISSSGEAQGIAYRALDHTTYEFRLLYLEPTAAEHENPSQDDKVIGELHHFPLSGSPPFVALSYCWGQSGAESPIVIDGTVQKCGSNGEAALQYLRNTGGVYVRIDQLCINQSDNAEKGHQVRIMLQIYTAATRVAVWMGPPGDDIDLFFSHTRAMSALVREEKYVDVVRAHADIVFLQRVSHALRAFCKRDYWTRVWIFLEFAVAEEGGQEVMETLVEMLRGFKTPANNFLEGVFTRRRRYQLRHGDPSARLATRTISEVENGMTVGSESLFAVLVTTLVMEIDYNQPQSTDHRDRVFAVMHFADDVAEFEGLSDYSLSCEQVYQNIGRRILLQGNIDVLSYCQFPRDKPLATWAPDWRMGIRRPNNGNPWRSKFDASKASFQEQAVLIPDEKTVQLRAVLVDAVVETGNVWDPNWVEELDCKAALEYLDDVENLCKKSPMFAEKIKAQDFKDVIRICTADRYHYKEPERQAELLEGFAQAVVWMSRGAGKFAAEMEDMGIRIDDTIGWQQPWFLSALKNLHSRRPFLSASGYVGLAPMHARPGDKIMIFLDGKTPYAIRETEEGFYEIVGES
ncbi:heterokaryon incompatibility protein [Colletotrichum navitas]|uniref:Heterokaryon incompatibility protein n=1 Tax=Colletotrichum navitas TaxID=681940 RepID=A0AAD8UXP6_9PEZI|nr:heterokaryon incompatibility protein [Colletotrichum navitas]KAK1569401.1 heterokaryon incompatibility protein [Colletotrichum navitas]